LNNRSWVENMIWSIILLNIAVLALVFLIPRTKIIVSHWGWSPEAKMEISGAMDTPNQYSKTYKVANQIRKLTKKDSIIFMPRDDWEFGSNRSVLIQRLYPRKVYFLGDKGFEKTLRSLVNVERDIFVMFNEDWGKSYCEKRPIKLLKNPGFGVCRLGDGAPISLTRDEELFSMGESR